MPNLLNKCLLLPLFPLELMYLYFPPSLHLRVTVGTTVENKSKLILTEIFPSMQKTWYLKVFISCVSVHICEHKYHCLGLHSHKLVLNYRQNRKHGYRSSVSEKEGGSGFYDNQIFAIVIHYIKMVNKNSELCKFCIEK